MTKEQKRLATLLKLSRRAMSEEDFEKVVHEVAGKPPPRQEDANHCSFHPAMKRGLNSMQSGAIAKLRMLPVICKLQLKTFE